MLNAYSYCGFCGTAFSNHSSWPKTCSHCGNITFRNPIPVSVVLLPVDRGVLVVRRAIPPRLGELALPGGFVNFGETWQEAGAREVAEETGLYINPDEIREFRVRSAPDGTLILFGLAQSRALADLPPFQPNAEASERRILTHPQPMAFPLHTEVLELYFSNPLATGSISSSR